MLQEYVDQICMPIMVKMKEDETAIDVRQVDYSMVDFEARSINGVLLNVDWSVGGIVTHQKHKHTI